MTDVLTRATRSCPCGTGAAYDACCGPLLRGERQAATAEELMRSRYSAHAGGDADYLWRTWHPRSRPAEVVLDAEQVWTGLLVEQASEHVVEFRASFVQAGRPGTLHERSRFDRRAGRWFYVGPVPADDRL